MAARVKGGHFLVLHNNPSFIPESINPNFYLKTMPKIQFFMKNDGANIKKQQNMMLAPSKITILALIPSKNMKICCQEHHFLLYLK